jgi:hypothetical protein
VGWFISIVPLNFGAAAPFRLNPHFVHVDAVSEFCVPQFGQNTHHLRQRSLATRVRLLLTAEDRRAWLNHDPARFPRLLIEVAGG